MRVLLCSQFHGVSGKYFPAGIVFPLGLAYVASMLKDHDVRVLDANVVADPEAELLRLLGSFEPEVVCVSLRNIDLLNPPGTNLSFYLSFRSMVRLIKERAPSCKLVVGGCGFEIFSQEIMGENPEIDFGVVSDGEVTFANLLRNWAHPERVRNLLVRDKNGVVSTGKGKATEFDLLPFPARDLFDLSEYKKTPYSMNVQSKRGCGFRCAYCSDPFLGGYVLQVRSAEKVVDEVEELVNNYGVKSFWFVDSIFNYPLENAVEICRGIRRRKLDVDWRAYFREDFLSVKFVREAVEAGCRSFEFHTDGACDQTLTLLNKRIDFADIERTIDFVCQVENAKVGYNLFYDLPRGNLKNLLALTRFATKATLRCKEKLEYLAMTRMRIHPHTLLYEVCLKEGKISSDTNLLNPVFYRSRSSRFQEVYFSLLEKAFSVLNRIVA